MASSSGSWLFIILLLIVGAVVIIGANEANSGFFSTGFFSTDNLRQSGTDIKNEGGKIVDQFLGNFSKKPEKEIVPPKAKAVKKHVVISDDQKDDMGRKDRVELNDLLDQVTK